MMCRLERSKDLLAGNSKNYIKEPSTTHLASKLHADNINISSRETITLNGANEVNIDVQENATLKGATIASINAEQRDNNNLNFKTNTLIASSLNNTYNSKSTSMGINIGGSLKENTTSNISLDYSNNKQNTKTKTLATLGNGNIQITNKEDSETRMLNSDIQDNTVDIYNIQSHKGLKVELDTRMLTEDGRNQIKEDLERTKRAGQAIADVATKESIKITDTFNHIADVQKDLDVQKAFALQSDGKGIEALQGEDSTIEQKQEAIKQYAQIYADTYGINIGEANIIATNKFIKGTHYLNDNKKSTIDINDNAQNNATDYAKTMGHEVTHARISQGTARDRESETLNEEYADTMGSYSADGMKFSSSTYTSVKLNTKQNTNQHIQTTNDKELLNTNNSNLKDRIKKDADKIDFESYWTLGDIDRMNTLSNSKSPIEDKINALVAVGLTQNEIKKSLKNNADFKALVKNGDEKFDTAYAEQKNKVDRVNSKIDVTLNVLRVGEAMAVGNIAVTHLVKQAGKEAVKTSIKGAVLGGATDIAIQSTIQTSNLLIENPNASVADVYDNIEIDYSDVAISSSIGVIAPSAVTTLKAIPNSKKATTTLKEQLLKTKSLTKKQKLEQRINNHQQNIESAVVIVGGVAAIKTSSKTIANENEEK